jgi:hypothetical protein
MFNDAAARLGWHQLRQTNRHQAAQLMTSLGGGASGQRLAAVVVGVLRWQGAAMDLPALQRGVVLVRGAAALNLVRAASPADRPRAVAALRTEAARYEAASRPNRAVFTPTPASTERMPQGVSCLPPQRPARYNFAQIDRATVVQTAAALESNSNPVSSPAYAAPADPIFANWFKALNKLGTRTLTSAEMNGLVQISLYPQWPAVGFDPAAGVTMEHEVHKYLGGQKTYPLSQMWTPGQGGESGLLASYTTDRSNALTQKDAGSEARIHAFMAAPERVQALQRSASAVNTYIQTERNALVQATPKEAAARADHYRSLGYFADSKVNVLAQPFIDQLKSSTTTAAQRNSAAQGLTQLLRQRAELLQQTSVSGVTAEVHIVQVMSRYLRDNRIDLVNRPTDQVDAVAVYQLYRRMLDAGELTNRATVEGWLKSWKVPYVP